MEQEQAIPSVEDEPIVIVEQAEEHPADAETPPSVDSETLRRSIIAQAAVDRMRENAANAEYAIAWNRGVSVAIAFVGPDAVEAATSDAMPKTVDDCLRLRDSCVVDLAEKWGLRPQGMMRMAGRAKDGFYRIYRVWKIVKD